MENLFIYIHIYLSIFAYLSLFIYLFNRIDLLVGEKNKNKITFKFLIFLFYFCFLFTATAHAQREILRPWSARCTPKEEDRVDWTNTVQYSATAYATWKAAVAGRQRSASVARPRADMTWSRFHNALAPY